MNITKRGVERTDLGWRIHRSMRKYCDSKPTSILYNLFHMQEAKPAFLKYLEAVWSAVDGNKREWSEILKESRYVLRYGQDPAENIAKYCMEMCTDEDWRGMAFLLNDGA